MTEQRETWADKAWNWLVKFVGAGVVVGAAISDITTDDTPSFYIVFFGILLMVLPIADVRVILRNWRRSNGNGKDATS